jgi:hypothetical protein
MYLRTTKRKTKGGTQVAYYQLAQNQRDPETGVCSAQIIHNFGRADELDREELVRLCGSIARVAGLRVVDPLEDEPRKSSAEDVLPEGVVLGVARELGVTHVVEALWERLGVGRALRRAAEQDGCRVPYERALLAMTVNRLLEPTSKLGYGIDGWKRSISRNAGA